MKRKEKRNISENKKRLIIISCFVGGLLLIGIVFVLIFVLPSSESNDEVINETQKIDQMENYDYYLDEVATDYYKTLYEELKTVLNNEVVNDEEYAKVVSKLFTCDLFTLDNKLTSSDIGGLQFVYSDFKEDFVNIAKTTLYSSVESNIYGDRNQKLPIVTNTEVTSIEKSTFNYGGTDYESYVSTLSLSYQEDLGYPTSYKVTLIKNDKYFQVVASE